jgi:hypothetical protein
MALYHANTVLTASTFLSRGALLSRDFVERHGLAQTPQKSDCKDKEYGVWDCIFLDRKDLHTRYRRRNGYGPVLFKFDLDILLRLPPGSEVLFTRSNPAHWEDDRPENERYFRSASELADGLRFDKSQQMLAIRTRSGKLNFPRRQAQIILDVPQLDETTPAESLYAKAAAQLMGAAGTGRVAASIVKRQCSGKCQCVTQYQSMASRDMDHVRAGEPEKELARWFTMRATP